MNPLLEYIKAQRPELAEVITVIDSIQSQQEPQDTTEIVNTSNTTHAAEPELQSLAPHASSSIKTENLKLKHLVKRLKRELLNEAEINHDFALAVGACTDCFGCDEDCENCEGQGKPGYFVPDLIHYKELIVPAIKKYNLHFNPNYNY